MSTASAETARTFRLPQEIWLWGGGLAYAALLWVLMIRGQVNLLGAILAFSVLLLTLFFSRTTAALSTLVYLNILGDLRRLMAATFGPPPTLDLLLLVGPAMAVILALPQLMRVRLTDRLSKAMFFLLVLMVLQVFNPLQGGISIGLSGAIFYIAPVLWFWVGRELASPAVLQRLLYRLLLPLSVVAALLGLGQTFIGFLPYEQAWINIATKTYVALYVGHSVRAFGFSVSGAEYAALLAIGGAIAAASFFGVKRYWTVAFPLLVVAVFLASSRGVVIRLIMSLAAVWVLRKGQKVGVRQILYTGTLMIAGLLVAAFAASHLGSDTTASQSNSAAQSLIAHQTGGFAHPLDPKYSTAGIHRDMIVFGFLQGFKNPIGHGLGSTTLAASKFGGDPSVSSSEVDMSDMFISLGLVGGLLYLYIVLATARRALRYVQRVDLSVGLPLCAVLVVTFTTWLIGGQYSTSSVVCFLIGALVHRDATEMGADPDPVLEPGPMGAPMLPAEL
ncbi:MAG TPA: hypothetical protein VGN16_14215 [Acidobacteriaceae bacterium]|jgi:hypothetical protein